MFGNLIKNCKRETNTTHKRLAGIRFFSPPTSLHAALHAEIK